MRLTYTSDPPLNLPPAVQSWVSKLIRERGPNGLGPLYRTLLISPPMARGFLRFFTALRYRTTLPPDVMELAMCRVGALNGAALEWMEHAPLLKEAGVSEEGVETVRVAKAGTRESAGGKEGEGKEEGGLSGRLWAVMRYVDAVTRDVGVSDEVFERMRRAMGNDERKILELTLTICGYNAISRFLRALDIAEMKDVEVGKAVRSSKL